MKNNQLEITNFDEIWTNNKFTIHINGEFDIDKDEIIIGGEEITSLEYDDIKEKWNII